MNSKSKFMIAISALLLNQAIFARAAVSDLIIERLKDASSIEASTVATVVVLKKANSVIYLTSNEPTEMPITDEEDKLISQVAAVKYIKLHKTKQFLSKAWKSTTGPIIQNPGISAAVVALASLPTTYWVSRIITGKNSETNKLKTLISREFFTQLKEAVKDMKAKENLSITLPTILAPFATGPATYLGLKAWGKSRANHEMQEPAVSLDNPKWNSATKTYETCVMYVKPTRMESFKDYLKSLNYEVVKVVHTQDQSE